MEEQTKMEEEHTITPPDSESLLRESPFLVEQGNCSYVCCNIYSNHLPVYIALAVLTLGIEVLFATPLSLCVTIPMLYYIIQVSSPTWKQSVILVLMQHMSKG